MARARGPGKRVKASLAMAASTVTRIELAAKGDGLAFADWFGSNSPPSRASLLAKLAQTTDPDNLRTTFMAMQMMPGTRALEAMESAFAALMRALSLSPNIGQIDLRGAWMDSLCANPMLLDFAASCISQIPGLKVCALGLDYDQLPLLTALSQCKTACSAQTELHLDYTWIDEELGRVKPDSWRASLMAKEMPPAQKHLLLIGQEQTELADAVQSIAISDLQLRELLPPGRERPEVTGFEQAIGALTLAVLNNPAIRFVNTTEWPREGIWVGEIVKTLAQRVQEPSAPEIRKAGGPLVWDSKIWSQLQ